jgi:ABC-type transport system involved in multi-copper enzyme maturation permease subunit
VLGLIVFAAERVTSRDQGFGGNPFILAGIGRAVYHWLLFFMLMLVCFLVPAFTGGAVAAERERRTLPLLQVTMLSPRQIVLGKFTSSMAFLMLLIVGTLPLVSVAFVLGGVTPIDVLRGYGMVVLTGFTFGMIGLGLSANLRRPLAAIVLSYALMATLTLGTFIMYGLIRASQGIGVERDHEPAYTLVLNPFVGTASALSDARGGQFNGATTSPFDPIINLLNRPSVITAFADDVQVDANGVPQRILPQLQKRGILPAQPKRLPVWASTVGWYLAICVLGYWLAVSGVRAPVSGVGFGRRRIRLGDT